MKFSESSVEEATCLALAKLWDDPTQNNFDCPWDWKEQQLKESDMAKLNKGSSPHDKLAKLLDNMEERLCGKVKDNELWKAMAEAYAIQVKPLTKQNIKCVKSLSPEALQAHYTKHHICSKRQIFSDLEVINMIQNQLKTSELLSKNDDGTIEINSSACKHFKQLSQHKLQLLNTLSRFQPKEEIPVVKIKPYSFS